MSGFTAEQRAELRARRKASELAAKARSIADDVNHVCGNERCIGSLSLAVLLLSEAVQALTEDIA